MNRQTISMAGEKRKNVLGPLTINIDVDGGGQTGPDTVIRLTHVVTLVRVGGKVHHQ